MNLLVILAALVLYRSLYTTKHFVYAAPEDYAGGEISLQGYIVGTVGWSTLCRDTNPSPTIFECDVMLPRGLSVEFQVQLPQEDAPGGVLYWGDFNYQVPQDCSEACTCSQWGGSGAPIGNLVVNGGYVFVTNPMFADPILGARHCESGEMLAYNGRINF